MVNLSHQVKKYNFDMIEKYPTGKGSTAQLFCSLNCLKMLTSHNSQPPSFISVRPQNQSGQQPTINKKFSTTLEIRLVLALA